MSTPQSRKMPEYEPLQLYIDGKWTDGTSGRSEPVINPATEEVLGYLPHASPEDLDNALRSAAIGFERWRLTLPAQRARILATAAELIRANAERMAAICVMEEGKTLNEARTEIAVSAERVEWLGEQTKRITGEVLPPSPHGALQKVLYEPVGVVLGLAPWNNPALMPVSKIAHALAAGCSIIIKPAEETPGTAVAMTRLFEQAGVPPGVINLVFGNPAQISSHLIASPVVRKVSFTGSGPVGKLLYQQCADGMKKITMELGGHAPVIVFDDVEVDQVASLAAMGKFRNCGQVCVSPTRFYVHERIADQFTTRFTDVARQLKVGNGLDASVQMGPLSSARRLQAMESFTTDAQLRGAKILTGGKRMPGRGFYWEPTVVSDPSNATKLMNEEPFGPIAAINRWSSFEQVIQEANRLPFGLAAYAFTRSQKRAAEVKEALQVGMVSINTPILGGADIPFGGVKASGIGREGGEEGLREFLVSKIVTHMRT